MVTYSDLSDAFGFVSAGAMDENEAYVCRDTGVIYWHTGFDNIEEEPELPEDIESDRYVAIPHKNELDLGKQLALQFAREVLPDRFPEVREFFSRRGAYARFKDMLERCDHLQQWYDYEANAEREALLQWCRGNDIEVSE